MTLTSCSHKSSFGKLSKPFKPKSSKFSMKSYVPAFFHIRPRHKKAKVNKGYIILVVLKCSMLHVKYQVQLSVFAILKKLFFFFSYMDRTAIFVMSPRPFVYIFVPLHSEVFT